MSATQQSDRTAAEAEPHRFRAPTVEEALQRARELLGEDAEIIEANRIRRGGIGGFFATELGVEVVAQPSTAGSPATAPRVAPIVGRHVPASTVDGDGDRREATPLPSSTSRTAGRGSADDIAAPLAAPLGGALGRAAWHAATSSTGRPLAEEQLTAPLIAELVARAAADERAAAERQRGPRIFRPWRVDGSPAATHEHPAHDTTPDAASVADIPTAASPSDVLTPELPIGGSAGVGPARRGEPERRTRRSRRTDATSAPGNDDTGVAAPTQLSFAEHFLNELMSDAAALRTRPDRNAVLPPARSRVVQPELPLAGDGDAAGPTTPDPDPATAEVAGGTEPSARPPRPARRRRATPIPAEIESTSAPTPARPAISQSTIEQSTIEPDAGVPAHATATGTAEQPADALAALVTRCLQAAADGPSAPRKLTVSMTTADGATMKVSVETTGVR
jgi:hypothetical protein